MCQEKKPHIEFGRRLKAIRKKLGLSQGDMAKRLEIANSTYQYYERGERDTPISVIQKLTTYEVNLNWVITGQGAIEDAEQHVDLHRPLAGEGYPRWSGGKVDINEFMEMTREVLDSESKLSLSLKILILSLHQALNGEEKYKALEKQLEEVGCKHLVTVDEARIRHDDPPNKKEEIIKRRAI